MTKIGIIETVIESNHKMANTKIYVVKQTLHNLLGILKIMALELLARVRGFKVEERDTRICIKG